MHWVWGIAGTVGLVNQMSNGNCNGGLLGGLFGGGNNACAEVAQLKAEKYTDQATIKAQRESFVAFSAVDDKIAKNLKEVTDGFLKVGNAVSRLDKEVECIKTTMEKDKEINALKLDAVYEKLHGEIKASHTELTGAIALESERRACGDENIYAYIKGHYVPGDLIIPASSICPPVRTKCKYE